MGVDPGERATHRVRKCAVRAGGWQRAIGGDLRGRTLGVLGLGNIGAEVARIGLAFGMGVIAWSQNLTQEKAAAVAPASSRKKISSDRGYPDHSPRAERPLARAGRRHGTCPMKPTAWLVNTARGRIVDEGRR